MIIVDTIATRTVTDSTPAFFDVNVPAGSWTAQATITGRNNAATASALSWALLIISESSTNNNRTSATLGPNGRLGNLALLTARTVSTTGIVRLVCQGAPNFSVFNVSIMATRVNTLTRVNLG